MLPYYEPFLALQPGSYLDSGEAALLRLQASGSRVCAYVVGEPMTCGRVIVYTITC